MALPPHLADLEGRLASRVDEALAGFRRAFEARLREATERLLADATDVAAPNVAHLLAEVESEALDAAPRREGGRAATATLLIAARAFDRATGQGKVLAALVAAGRSAADRVALLLVRDDLLVAYEGSGFDRGPAPGTEVRFEGALRERLYAARGCLALGAEAAAEVAEQLGWAAGGAAVVVPLVLRDRIAALLWADRATTPPDLASLQLLALLAAQRLELQALSPREFTPTLYEGSEAPGAPLPLWSSLPEISPAAPPAEPSDDEAEAAEPTLDAAEAFEIVGDEAAAPPLRGAPVSELAAEPELSTEAAEAEGATSWSLEAEAPAPAPEVEEPMEAVADELWTGSVTAPLETSALFEPAVEAGPADAPTAEGVAPAPTWELATLESEPASAGAAVLDTFELEAVAIESAAEAAIAIEPAAAVAAEPPSFEPVAESAESEALFEPGAAEPETGAIAEALFEAVPEPAVEPVPEPAAAAPVPPASFRDEDDLLQTRRLQIPSFPLAGEARRPEESTAPLQVEAISTLGLGQGAASTHEFPAPDLAAPAPPPRPAPDVFDDETVMTRRLPVMPAALFEPNLGSQAAAPATPAEPLPSLASPFGTSVAPLFAAPVPSAPIAPIPPITPIEPPSAPTPPADDPMDRTASRQRSTEVAPPPDLQGPGRAFLSGRAQRTASESPAHEEAKRLARLLISEIKLYNEEQVLEGRRNRDLYHRLKEDIDRSRQIYEERVDPAVRSGSDYFHQELVRSLAGGDSRALGI